MSLIDLVDNSRTDKNGLHSYLTTYNNLFFNKKNSCKHFLEIGIDHGGSIKLWTDYFKNATVHAIDIKKYEDIWDELKNKENIVLHTSTDAYNVKFFTETFFNPNVKFDIIIDDGPHTLESMILFLNTYIHVMEEDGILVVEDVQDMSWINVLIRIVPTELKKYIKVFDLRSNKNRYDDILFVIDKSKY